LRIKGKERDAVLETIAINQRAIDVAEDALEAVQKSLKRGTLADLNQESAIKNLAILNAEIATKTQTNAALTMQLETRGEEVYVQKASLPERKSAPKRSLVVIIVVLVAGFALLLWVFLLEAWHRSERKTGSAEKIKRIKAVLGMRVIE
jgi:LPS O-antigen subunit length determinant protein (WzzB/FepE family)